VHTTVRLLVSIVASASLAVAVLASAAGPAAAASAAIESPGSLAAQRLTADASDGAVTLQRTADGHVSFAGTAGAVIDNPAVTRSTSVTAAARAHLGRYGAALGTDRPGTSLVQRQVTHDVAGGDVVHFSQRVGGLPVVGGDVVVSLDSDRELVSLSSTMSSATRVAPARVDEARAAGLARTVVATSARTRDVENIQLAREGRWVLDSAVTGTPSPGVATVWRFQVTAGSAHRELFVDDQTGAVLLDMDANQTVVAPGTKVSADRSGPLPSAAGAIGAPVNRIVCDNGGVELDHLAADVPCPSASSTPARVEGDPETNNDDVDEAYDNAGAVSDFYASLGIDLTELIGADIGGGEKALAQTVRVCYDDWCPFENAFWNGREMYYGTGFAVADDIVGHEMTHGVTGRFSGLFYWGESGAINESMSDVMGEIVDHRNLTPGEPNSWTIGEDLPGLSGGFRSMANPPDFGQPDRMQSIYWHPSSQSDSGGVHYNSGVANKTAYLIMNGGTFNGQTITGIDGDDQTFVKSARLYLLTDQSLASGADHRALSAVLQQSCRTLVATPGSGFTAADCDNVHKATLATELDQVPLKLAKSADAADTCPAGEPVKTLLFDSETGDAGAAFAHEDGSRWTRAEDPYWGPNAKSGRSAWHNSRPWNNDYEEAAADSMVLSRPVAVPTSGHTYLRFNGWHFLATIDYIISQAQPITLDAGTVEVDDLSDSAPPVDTASLPWINGPRHKVVPGGIPWEDPDSTAPISSPATGRMAFGGYSDGWVASALDLTSFAGRSIKPQFTVSTDNLGWFIGWFLDDITIYNCAPVKSADAPPTAGTVTVAGKAKVGRKLTVATAGWATGTTYAYQWLRDGKAIKSATRATYRIKKRDAGHRLKVVVTGTTSAGGATATSAVVKVRGRR